MTAITGRFEYDFDEQVLYFMPDERPDEHVSPLEFKLHPEGRDSIFDNKSMPVLTPERCCLWFDYVGNGKSRLSIISCDAPKI